MKLEEEIEKLIAQTENVTYDNNTQDIIKELQEIKSYLKKIALSLEKQSKDNKKSYFKNKQYYDFVNKLRKELKPDVENNIYPEIIYQTRRLGIHLNGYLYSKETLKKLTAQEAFEVYRFLYENRYNLDKYIRKKDIKHLSFD